MNRVFLAKFRTRCPRCGEWVEIGTEIAQKGKPRRWGHKNCPMTKQPDADGVVRLNTCLEANPRGSDARDRFRTRDKFTKHMRPRGK